MTTRLNSNNKIVGVKQVKRAINLSMVETVFIALDAEKKVTDEVIDLCNIKHIPIVYVDNMKILGDACGIDINAAVAALLK